MSESLMAIGEKLWREAGEVPIFPLPHKHMRAAGSDPEKQYIMVAPPTTRQALMILAHELGHIVTTPIDEDPHRAYRLGRVVENEFNATRWGVNALRRAGFQPTKDMLNAARKALRGYADDEELQHQLKSPEVEAFLKGGDL